MSFIISQCKRCGTTDKIKSNHDRFYYTSDNRQWKGALCPDCKLDHTKNPTIEELRAAIERRAAAKKKKDYLANSTFPDYPWDIAYENICSRVVGMRFRPKYTREQFKKYFGIKLAKYKFTWDGYGKDWFIDHVTPIWVYRDVLNINNPDYWHRIANLQPITWADHVEKTKREERLRDKYFKDFDTESLKEAIRVTRDNGYRAI